MSARARLSIAALAASLALASSASIARADTPAGSIGGHLVIADGDLGGAAMLDVWAPFDWFRLGGFFAVGVVPAERDHNNRVFMPIGVSAAAEIDFGDVGLSFRARAGLWGGATQSEKLTLGPFFGGGAFVLFDFGIGPVLAVGVDVWAIIASDTWHTPTSVDDPVSASVAAFAPSIGFTWSP